MQMIYKICPAAEWRAAEAAGLFTGSAVDVRDGFVHLSAGHQVRETAARHFAGQDDLVLVAFAAAELAGLRWETSRGGDRFPHVYDTLPVSAARWVKPLPLADGAHRFPDEVSG